MSAKVTGYCPMGCGETLFLGAGGYVTCSRVDCGRPDAVADLLADRENQHIVVLSATEFTVRHPLHERLGDALMRCELHRWIGSRPGPPAQPGRYRVFWTDQGNNTWERLP